VSLLTDALRLREGRRPSRGGSGPSFPPFHGPRPGRWIVGVLGLCVLGVLGWWKGGWLVEKVEVLAGVAPAQPAPNLLASAPREEIQEKTEVQERKTAVPKTEAVSLEEKAAGPAATPTTPQVAIQEEVRAETKAPAVVSAKAPPADVAISEEGKKRGEVLLTDSLVKAVAEKPVGAVKIPDREAPVAAVVPEGGLQPMKVELAEEDLVVATPEEREKKKIEAVEEFLRVLKVQGVRLQGAESRILVDGSPIGLGEKVGALGLVLESVEPQKIIFSDASGKQYPKSY